MYARGLTTRQISEQIEEIYGFECSEGFISDVTDKILQDISDWQNRPLDDIYPIMFIDAVHFSVREDHIIKKLAAYVILGITMDGRKDVISLQIGENESAKYWLGVLNDLKYVPYKDKKAFAADLKTIYLAPNEEQGQIYKFSADVRKVIYTTNAIESLNSTYKKLNRQRSVFPNDTALLKSLYLSTLQATKKWNQPLRNWAKVYGEFSIMYEGRFPI